MQNEYSESLSAQTADNTAEITEEKSYVNQADGGIADSEGQSEPEGEVIFDKNVKQKDRRTGETKAFSERLKSKSNELENKYLDEIKLRDEQLNELRREYENSSPAIMKAREIIRQSTISEDLRAIKEAYPEADVSSIEDMGEVFFSLMASGSVDAVTAYEAQALYESRKNSNIPSSMGSVRASGATGEKEYYSPEEVDRLSDSDFDSDPNLWGKVRKSMLKWY